MHSTFFYMYMCTISNATDIKLPNNKNCYFCTFFYYIYFFKNSNSAIPLIKHF